MRLNEFYKIAGIFFALGFVLPLVMGNCSIAQNLMVVDSLKKRLKGLEGGERVNVMVDISWAYQFVDGDSAISYGTSALKLAKHLNYKEGETDSYNALGTYFLSSGKYEVALSYLQKALKMDSLSKHKGNLARDKTNIGNVHQRMGNYAMAATNYFDALTYFESINDSFSTGSLYVNIGNNFNYQNQHERSLHYYEQALKIFTEQGDDILVAQTREAIGITYVYLHRFNEALSALNSASESFKKLNQMSHISSVCINLGFLYEEKKDYLVAIEQYEKALEIALKIGDLDGQMIALLDIASCYNNLGELDQAEQNYLKVVDLAIASKSSRILTETYLGLAELNRQKKHFEQAYSYEVLYAQWKDSLLNKERIDRIEELAVLHEVENQEKEIQLLKEKEKTASATADKHEAWLIASGGLICAIVVVAFLYIRQRKNKEMRRQLELEQKALRAQMNPHFIFNSLNSIQRMYIERKDDQANEYTADFAELMRRILDNSDKSKISLKEELETLRLYLELEKIRCNGMMEYAIELASDLDLNEFYIPPLVIQPFVENAIWHGILPKKKKGQVTIRIYYDQEKNVRCDIEDNGVGWDPDDAKYRKSDSKGISITSQRLRSDVKIEKVKGGGTRISFILNRMK